MPWIELVSITARVYERGDRPDDDYSGHFWVTDAGAVYEDTQRDGLRDDDVGLVMGVVSYYLEPTPNGRADDPEGTIGLLIYEAYECSSVEDVFRDHMPDIHALFNRYRGASSERQIALVTAWECDAGMRRGAPWGAEEYDSDWELCGYLDINGMAVALVPWKPKES